MKGTELHIFLEDEDRLRIQMKGDKVTIAKMLATAMEAQKEIMSMVLAAAAAAMEEKGMSSLDLRKLARRSGINL